MSFTPGQPSMYGQEPSGPRQPVGNNLSREQFGLVQPFNSRAGMEPPPQMRTPGMGGMHLNDIAYPHVNQFPDGDPRTGMTRAEVGSGLSYHDSPLPVTPNTLGSAASASAWRLPAGHVMPFTAATAGSVFRPF